MTPAGRIAVVIRCGGRKGACSTVLARVIDYGTAAGVLLLRNGNGPKSAQSWIVPKDFTGTAVCGMCRRHMPRRGAGGRYSEIPCELLRDPVRRWQATDRTQTLLWLPPGDTTRG